MFGDSTRLARGMDAQQMAGSSCSPTEYFLYASPLWSCSLPPCTSLCIICCSNTGFHCSLNFLVL